MSRSRFRLRSLQVAIALAYGFSAGGVLAQTLPTGGQVVNGVANIQTQGSNMTVTNTPGAIINWQGFPSARASW